MPRISESELVLPALSLIEQNARLDTTGLIKGLRDLLNPDEEDLEVLEGRVDDKFSQKVRNLKSHNTLENSGYVTYNNGYYEITVIGKEFLLKNIDNLKLIVEEENILNKISNPISSYYIEFKNSTDRINKLLDIESLLKNDLKAHFYNMLYSSLITSLETYLADAIKYHLSINKDFLKIFVETFKDYRDEKINFNDIFNHYDNLELKVEESLLSLLYHNLPKIKGIYKSTFSVEFNDIGELMKSVLIRHDLVHRNGKTTKNELHNIIKDDIVNLFGLVNRFVDNIEDQLKLKIVTN